MRICSLLLLLVALTPTKGTVDIENDERLANPTDDRLTDPSASIDLLETNLNLSRKKKKPKPKPKPRPRPKPKPKPKPRPKGSGSGTGIETSGLGPGSGFGGKGSGSGSGPGIEISEPGSDSGIETLWENVGKLLANLKALELSRPPPKGSASGIPPSGNLNCSDIVFSGEPWNSGGNMETYVNIKLPEAAKEVKITMDTNIKNIMHWSGNVKSHSGNHFVLGPLWGTTVQHLQLQLTFDQATKPTVTSIISDGNQRCGSGESGPISGGSGGSGPISGVSGGSGPITGESGGAGGSGPISGGSESMTSGSGGSGTISGKCSGTIVNQNAIWGTATKSREIILKIPLSFELPAGEDGFKLQIRTDVQLTKITMYDENVSPTSGKSFTITPKKYFHGKHSGETLEVSFQISWSSADNNNNPPQITSVIINGLNVCSSGSVSGSGSGSGSVDGGWTEFGVCSVTCGDGIKERTCTNPPPAGDGADCKGNEEKICSLEECPVTGGTDGGWRLGGKIVGLYLLLADDGAAVYKSDYNWEPRLHRYQQTGANVLFFTFIHPITMKVPPSFKNLAATRGTHQDGAIPKSTKIIFAIGGIAYSKQFNPWDWLTSRGKAEDMAVKVAKWKNQYNIDGIDLDIENIAGEYPEAGTNMIHFIKKIREIEPSMIISQPTFGIPQIPANNEVINSAWSEDGISFGLLDSVGIMVYQGTESLKYVDNYSTGKHHLITAKVPTDRIIVGVEGCASFTSLEALANASLEKDLGGIMVWASSVRKREGGDGYKYGCTAKDGDNTAKGFNRAMEMFKKTKL